MTNEQLFDDLKQFVHATISQAVSDLATKEDMTKLATKGDLADLKTELIEGTNQQTETILNAFEEVEHRHEARLDEHEASISTLKHRAA